MSWFSRKPVVEFACHLEGVEKIMPIIPAKQYRHPWLIRAFQDYALRKKQPEYEMQKSIHIAKCPGIIDMVHQGWILRAWQDILIDTAEDGASYTWQTPYNETKETNWDSVSLHQPDELVNFFQYWDSSTKFIFKLNVAWQCKIPKGYALMTLPVMYADEDRFETLSGIHRHEYGWAMINPQIKWKAPAGKSLIKAGTPIAQFVLIKIEEVETKVYYSEKLSKINKLQMMFTGSRYVHTARAVKEFLGRHNHD
jgi:hypothetical protein